MDLIIDCEFTGTPYGSNAVVRGSLEIQDSHYYIVSGSSKVEVIPNTVVLVHSKLESLLKSVDDSLGITTSSVFMLATDLENNRVSGVIKVPSLNCLGDMIFSWAKDNRDLIDLLVNVTTKLAKDYHSGQNCQTCSEKNCPKHPSNVLSTLSLLNTKGLKS